MRNTPLYDHVSFQLSDHIQHSQFNSEHALWLDEVKLWQQQHDKALAKLADIEKALQRRASALTKHTLAIRSHIEAERQHEKSMAEAEKDPSNKNAKQADEKTTQLHKHELKVHAQQAKLHQEYKTNHLKLMAMLNMLNKEAHKDI